MSPFEKFLNVISSAVVILLVVLLFQQYRDCGNVQPGSTIIRRDTVVYRDTQYIPIPRYINKVRVVHDRDTIFVRDTTSRGDTLTVALPKELDSATVDIRYAPERRYVDTVLVKEATVSQGPPWWHYVISAVIGLLIGVLIK